MNKRFQLILTWSVVVSLGAYHTVIGILMFALPEWFFDNPGNISPFPPYNRHYISDFGAYQLPLGIALLLASRRPFQHRLLIGVAVIGNLLHSLNHVYDDLSSGLLLSLTIIGLLLMGLTYFGLMVVNLQARY